MKDEIKDLDEHKLTETTINASDIHGVNVAKLATFTGSTTATFRDLQSIGITTIIPPAHRMFSVSVESDHIVFTGREGDVLFRVNQLHGTVEFSEDLDAASRMFWQYINETSGSNSAYNMRLQEKNLRIEHLQKELQKKDDLLRKVIHEFKETSRGGDENGSIV